MSKKIQSLENHVKIVPPYHVLLFAILAINLLWSVWDLIKSPSAHSAWALVMGIAWLIVFALLRGWPLKVQDRLIRLEERLRLAEILPEDLRGRTGELTVRQLVSLRFASDEELTDLVRQVLDGGLDAKEIKKQIKNWRADHQRV
jgi:hypothetical protein